MPNTHRRRRRDSTVELSRVGGVYAPVGCHDPVYNSAANGVGLEVAGSRLAMAASWLRYTADTTQLDFIVAKLFRLVETVAN